MVQRIRKIDKKYENKQKQITIKTTKHSVKALEKQTEHNEERSEELNKASLELYRRGLTRTNLPRDAVEHWKYQRKKCLELLFI